MEPSYNTNSIKDPRLQRAPRVYKQTPIKVSLKNISHLVKLGPGIHNTTQQSMQVNNKHENTNNESYNVNGSSETSASINHNPHPSKTTEEFLKSLTDSNINTNLFPALKPFYVMQNPSGNSNIDEFPHYSMQNNPAHAAPSNRQESNKNGPRADRFSEQTSSRSDDKIRSPRLNNSEPQNVNNMYTKTHGTQATDARNQNTSNSNLSRNNSVARNLPELTSQDFQWSEYLILTESCPAPRHAFTQSSQYEQYVNKFEINMKLEARDPRNQSSFCLATVTYVEGIRLQLRFDGAGNSNDFWVLIDSHDIRPVKSKPDEPLAPPVAYTSNFEGYLVFVEKTLSKPNTICAPESIFYPPPQQPDKNFFKTGMKLEAVDRKNPLLICPATIGSVCGKYVEIIFDGYRGSVDYKCEFTSRDLFPINFCRDTGSNLVASESWRIISPTKNQKKNIGKPVKNNDTNQNPPVVYVSSTSTSNSSSPVVKVNHRKLKTPLKRPSPEPDDNTYCQRVIPVTDWLYRKNNIVLSQMDAHIQTDNGHASPDITTNEPVCARQGIGQVKSSNSSLHQTSILEKDSKKKIEPSKESSINESQTITADTSPTKQQMNLSITKPEFDIRSIAGDSNPSDWNVEQVIAVLSLYDQTLKPYADILRCHEIDGKAMLLLTADIMLKHMDMRVGPVLKIINFVDSLQRDSNISIKAQ